jgi:hypothetical protein
MSSAQIARRRGQVLGGSDFIWLTSLVLCEFVPISIGPSCGVRPTGSMIRGDNINRNGHAVAT